MSPSWLAGWKRRKSHAINGTTVGAQTDYQIRIVAHKGAGSDSGEDVYLGTNVRNDFGDVRFTDSDGLTELDYWLESYISGVSAVFWIELPNIPESPDTATIYVYYDKGDETTTGNGANTFILFDHFDDAVLDTTKWKKLNNPTLNIANSEINITRTLIMWCSVNSKSSYGPHNLALRIKAKIDDTDNVVGFNNPNNPTPNSESAVLGWIWKKQTRTQNNMSTTDKTLADLEFHIYHVYDIKWVSSKVVFAIDDEDKNTHTTNIPDMAEEVLLGIGDADSELILDWITLRKFVDPEPTHGSWEKEEARIPKRLPIGSIRVGLRGMS